jgi:hypothetical protein
MMYVVVKQASPCQGRHNRLPFRGQLLKVHWQKGVDRPEVHLESRGQSFVDRLEWTPRLRQRVRGTVVVGCCGLYSSKFKREALQNRRSGHELCWRATHEGIAG